MRSAERAVKVVCTLGPASSDAETLRNMVRAGMDVARLNFAHGSHEEHAQRVEQVRNASESEGVPVAILQDLPGPKVRIGAMAPGVVLPAGSLFELRCGSGAGDGRSAFIDDPLFFEELQKGDHLLLADGSVELQVEGLSAQIAECRVLAGGALATGKGVNPARGFTKRGILSERDLRDLAFGARLGVDLVSVSYVRSAADLLAVRRELRKLGARVPLVAKIETSAAVENLDAILEATDAVMLARGDLALQIPFERVPVEQKRILKAAQRRGRPVITATQMLASMVSEQRPTRAEVNDVANAVLDGTDAVMLSEESAVGAHPALAVETLARIATATAAAQRPDVRDAEGLSPELHDLGVVAEMAARTAREIGARGLVVWSRGGLAARLLSRARPGLPIVAPTALASTARLLAIVRGVFPLLAQGAEVEPQRVCELLGAQPSDHVPLVVFGHELGSEGRRVPWLKVAYLDEPSGWARDPRAS